MTKQNGKKGVVTISVIAVLVFTAVILFLSISDHFGKNNKVQKVSEPQNISKENTPSAIASDALPGENNKQIKAEISPEEIHGKYFEEHDGWYYEFSYAPDSVFHGTYLGAYDQNHASAVSNPEKDYYEQGSWILENGEVKLFINNQYAKSLWSCGDYIIDSRNYFVGEVPENKDEFQAAFTCKAGESGDTQILNFYSDGKMIMEIIKNDGVADSAAQPALEQDTPPYQLAVGTYTINDDVITTKMIGSAEKVLYIVDDGIAGWVYRKE